MPNLNKLGWRGTNIHFTPRGLTVMYHRTPAVSIDRVAGRITLDNAGHHTYTTKTRMNQAANQFGFPYKVYERKGKWYAEINGNAIPFSNNRKAVLTDRLLRKWGAPALPGFKRAAAKPRKPAKRKSLRRKRK